MAAKVQLDIESKANTQALKQAIADLEKLGMAGKSTNQVFKQTSNLEGYKAALVKSYETARTFGDQMKATRTAFSDTSKAIKAAQAYLGENKNNMFTFIDEKGVQQQTRDMALIEKQIRGFLGNVVADTQNFQKSMTRKLGEFEGFDSFKGKLQTTADAYKLMGNELGGVQYKMTAIQQQILDMTAAQADPAEIQKLTDEYKKLAAEHKELSEAANGSGTRIKNLIKNFVSAQLIVWAIRKAFQMLTQGLKEVSTAAAEAEQTFGRFDAVFEGLERANAAIGEMVDNFGVAKSSAADILSSIGNTALGFGASAMEAAQFSETVAKSLSDIMAFRDVQGTISDFAQRFMSGASGNVENFRAIGSIVRQSMVDLELQKQGWENLTGQALEWAKVQARVNIVLEQQKKAMGATEREWDTLLSIQRRNAEQTKQMKENIGETINQFFKPMSLWILTLKENWNAAYEANKRYNEGVYDPIPEENYKDSPTARVLRKELIAARNLQSNAMATGAGGSFSITELEQIRDFAERFGATLRYTAEEAVDVGFKISDSVWEQIDAYDAYIKKINDARKAENARLAASQAEYEGIRDFFADVGSMMGMGGSGSIYDVRDYVKKDAADFVSPLERLLGFEGGEGAELEAKIKGLSNMVESLFNTSISGSTEYIRTQASEMLTVVASALGEAQKAKAAMESATNYNKAKSSIEDELATMQKRNELEAQYGKENDDIVTIKLQQWKAEREALELFKERLHATGKGKESYQEYLDLMELISKQYGLQLDRAEDIAKAAKDAAAEQARTSASDMFVSASRELSYLGENGDALKQQDEMNDSIAKYEKYLKDAGETTDSITEKSEAFRKILESINKTNADADADKKAKDAEKAAQSLTDAYQSQLQSIRDNITLMEYRSSIEGQNEKEVIDLLVQKKQQEMEAASFKQQQIKAGMDAVEAEGFYQDQLELIAKQHGLNLGLLEKQIQATKDLAVEQARTSASDMFTAATRELSYLGKGGDALKAQDDLNDKVEQYIANLSKTDAGIQEVIDKAKVYRTLLEQIAALEGDNAAAKTAEDFTKSYQDRVDTLRQSYESLKLSSDLEKQYGSERASVEQKHIEALQEAWRYMSEQVKLGMDATEANEMYLDSAKAITAEYELQLGLLEEQSKVKRSEALQEASKAIAGVVGQRALVGASDAQKTQARIDEQVYAFAEELTQGGAKLKETLDQTAEYRRQLEMLAAEEARQAVWDGIKSQWEGTGDVGMISGWVEAFASGGTMAGIAKVATDLLTSFESVNELLSIVTKFIDYVAPAIDQFLAPLMPVLEMILSITADLLLPVLQVLFPVIQGLSVVLIYLLAVVKTVTNALSWLVDTIVTAIWNIAHPFRTRAFRDLGDETVAIWSDANAKVETIMNMELETRMDFVNQLTDAQQGQLDAYNEMFKAGMLTLTQYNALVGKNVYGRNFDNVDIASFASGGNFITNGEQIIRVGEAGREHVQITPLNSTGYANRNIQQVGGNSYSVVVNGANGDPEEIAMAVRQEFKRMERRGVRYA